MSERQDRARLETRVLRIFTNDPSDPEAIDANRHSRMTDSQRGAVAGQLFMSGCSLLALGLVGGCVLIAVVPALLTGRETFPPALGVFVLAGVALLAPFVWFLARAVLTALDLASMRVEQADGEVVWSGRQYTPRVAVQDAAPSAASPIWQAFTGGRGWKLHTVYGRATLQPGAYRFYYLPRSRWLLSAEPLKAATPGEEANLAGVLAQVFHFTPEALDANRAGRLGPGQAPRLLLADLGQAIILFVIVAVFLAFAYGFTRAGSGSVFLLFLLVFGAALAIAGATLARTILWIVLDVSRGQVAMMQGAGSKTATSGSRSNSRSYYYTIGGLRSPVSYTQYNALVEGVEYRVYYLPRSKRVVSLEPISH